MDVKIIIRRLPSFLNNTPDTTQCLAPGGSNEVAIRESLFAGYMHDDWRFRPNLTVNLGCDTNLQHCRKTPTTGFRKSRHLLTAQRPV